MSNKGGRLCCMLLLTVLAAVAQPEDSLHFYGAAHPFFQYTGRIDFSNPQMPRYWMPGVYISARFSGTHCTVLINDEVRYGSFHNYIEIKIDDQVPVRLQLAEKHNEIEAASNLPAGKHRIVICKNTEAGIGYIEFEGLKCSSLERPLKKPIRKIECFGNSITCGTGSDQTAIPCGKGVWHDQHNAWLSYGAVTARNLHAQCHLSAVSGIGLMHSCCNLSITMPHVFDKINMRDDSIAWNFSQYQPDVVTICLGQNDGMQDTALFCQNYIAFLQLLRTKYPSASLVCISSPMADEKLLAWMKTQINAVVSAVRAAGDKNTYACFFSKRFHAGCDGHPSLEEHQQIAKELTAYIRKLKKW